MREDGASRADGTRLAVLGKPIAHSQSPVIHAAAYAVLDLDWEYSRIELDTADLSGFLDERGPEWRGFSVTMPLKGAAHECAAVLDPVARESGAVNTLLRLVDDGRKPRWAGFNTDVAGLIGALQEAGLNAAETVVLGAGATAASAVLAARGLGARRVTVLARRPDAAEDLAQRFSGSSESGSAQHEPVLVAGAGFDSAVARDAATTATLCISTLPGDVGTSVGIPSDLRAAPLFDVAYEPWPSPLAVRWGHAGTAAHSGAAMLLHQAVAQIRIFVNGDASLPLDRETDVLAAMRAAGVEE